MKNIFLIPTENSSRLSIKDGVLILHRQQWRKGTQNIHITSDSKFVRDEYITDGIEVIKSTPKLVDAQGLVDRRDWKKILMTTDPELIKDGVHPIGEDFLQWFVENPTCIKVEVVYGLFNPMGRQVDPNDLGQNHSKCVWKYKIITTKEEPKKVLTEEDIFNQKDIDAVTDYINKEQQKQHLIDMMESDEELGLYDEKIEDIELEEVRGSSHCQFSVVENKLAIIYRNQLKILQAIKMLSNGKN